MKLVVLRSGISIPEVEQRHVAAIVAAAREAGLAVATPQSPAEEELEIVDADISFGGVLPHLFPLAEKLRWVQAVGAGVDAYLKGPFPDSDVVLTSEKGLVGVHLAEQAFALLLGLTRGVAMSLRQPGWDVRVAIRNRSTELDGHTAVIVGLGGTGAAIARRAAGFGMRVLAMDPEPVTAPAEVESLWGTEHFHELLGEADVVFITAPLTKDTRQMFDAAAFAAMKSDGLLVNVSRGEIVDRVALEAALDSEHLRGAGLDVVPGEPLPADDPLWTHPHAIVTPHIAGASPIRGDRIVGRFRRNLAHFLAHEPLEGVIDKHKEY